MSDNQLLKLSSELQSEFALDTQIIANQTIELLTEFYPMYINGDEVNETNVENDTAGILNSLQFYKIDSCTIEKTEDIAKFLNEKMQKFISALYSIGISFCYGVKSDGNKCDLVIGISGNTNSRLAKKVIEGLLSGINLIDCKDDFHFKNSNTHFGMINGIPSLLIDNRLQKFDLSSVIKALNGEKFTVLIMAKPISGQVLQSKKSTAIQIRDNCMSISKRNVSRQQNITRTENEAFSNGTQSNINVNVNGGAIGLATGAGIGLAVGGPGGAIIGGGIGMLVGQSVSGGYSKGISDSYSKSISEAISEGGSMSLDIQNGFAIELMKLADNCLERLKLGHNTGFWQTSLTYSADNKMARDLIQGCIYGEIAKPNPELLPPRIYQLANEDLSYAIREQHVLIPKGLFSEENSSTSICSYISSQELSAICAIPQENSPAFELKEGTFYPLIAPNVADRSKIEIGNICDGERALTNISFSFSNEDLNKHTFVCGITGSGKTNTVKEILRKSGKPFLVIESAKKEYRNLKAKNNNIVVYTLGKPEINCPQINPFYILPGISPQMHIDLLKDLFNASFSFYGPMPYILEKCLHNIYTKKGWNLTLGYHPYLVNKKSQLDLFDASIIAEKYSNSTHTYIFPTMSDLKEEIENYILHELEYDGEMSGNIKTAIKTRLESLCVGAKGYMYNTTNVLNWTDILASKCVFEMEGLADDSDKAFSVGLLVIFISEQRQVEKEIEQNTDAELKHLLVIEEAHRLLKNVETEKTSENMGNPKGKAVEHFTNMIAEMRSYGQGVIIAEQIPTKIAPDVIKNTSNKIVHRIVSADDQAVISNSICIPTEKGIYLGVQKTGYALCHKEGMSLPVSVKVSRVENCLIKDADLYMRDVAERFESINESAVSDALGKIFELKSIPLLANLMISNYEVCYQAISLTKELLFKKSKENNVSFISGTNGKDTISLLLSKSILKIVTWGVFSNNEVIDSKISDALIETIKSPHESAIINLKDVLSTFYSEDTKKRGINIIVELVFNYYYSQNQSDVNLNDIISQWFVVNDEDTINEIINCVMKRGCAIGA
ncbi:ATP-binding protein [Paenibacillus qinlingensis]|uniref:ATP-binding protein n=1 Tax=Paenibacillus qinlingensis TaxID=1837343 RepID=UPI001567506F|nr:DUF87 domain-containing protein [Paenibacillus qinlingensis]NQX62595.1 ATP-binding protein [Paenibacillus qinlingensis]